MSTTRSLSRKEGDSKELEWEVEESLKPKEIGL